MEINCLFPKWCIILAENLTVYGIIDFVEDMSTDANREMRPKILGMPYLLLSLSLIIFISLSPEMLTLAYYRIEREDCEVTTCSSPLGEAIISASRLTSVGSCTLL